MLNIGNINFNAFSDLQEKNIFPFWSTYLQSFGLQMNICISCRSRHLFVPKAAADIRDFYTLLEIFRGDAVFFTTQIIFICVRCTGLFNFYTDLLSLLAVDK